ncbi:hypothetical protein C0993_008587 [Termitomyces sp. T159_Od127]|nr:hypothetical protein C0993_008587 [Termitomyces sp. T159_Od127]
MCMEAPRTGSRLTQTADEALMELARRFDIPIVFVLTKSDLLYNEFFQKATKHLEPGADTSEYRSQALKETEDHLNASIEKLQEISQADRACGLESLEGLEHLTKVTRKCLKTTETLVPWAVAQRIDPKQKVETSIQEGFKKYWKDLGKSTVFQGHVLADCLCRIHLDIIKVWNFRDPHKLLSGDQFRLKMVELINPFIPEPSSDSTIDEKFPALETLGSIFDSIFPFASVAIDVAGLTVAAIHFLYQRYQAVYVKSLPV